MEHLEGAAGAALVRRVRPLRQREPSVLTTGGDNTSTVAVEPFRTISGNATRILACDARSSADEGDSRVERAYRCIATDDRAEADRHA
jgi:hypothetical protein